MESEQSVVPSLQIVSGPLAGRLFKIDRDLIIIGRNPDCDIVLAPKSVSRRHAAIVRRSVEYVLKDIGSTRGTYINGERLTQPAILSNGCTVQIGELQLVFKSQAVQIHEGEEDQSTVFAAIDMTTPSDRIFPVIRPEEKLLALQKINQAFGTTLVLGELLDKVLESLFEIFPRAERGFVLLQNRDRAILAPEAIRTRGGPTGDLGISKSILQRVLNDGQAILSKDLLAEFPNIDSVTEGRIRSLMCVPILDQKQRSLGIIQIDTQDGRGRFTQEDLDLLASVASQISVAVQNAQLHHDLLKQHELEQELQFARQVMQALLPERPGVIEGYEFWDCYEPARHVGGDYYGFIPLFEANDTDRANARRWAISVGDVVGKGLPAALLTARLSAEIRLVLQGESDPARVVSRLNRHLTENGVLDMYITFLLAILDLSSNRLSIVNAGHPYPLIRRRDGRVEEFASEASGLPLAIQGDWAYETAETTLELGDIVILYTDGVTDALNPSNERFGDASLRKHLKTSTGGPAATGESLIQAVRNHVAGRAQFDDITMVAFGRV
jgi:serine phosphatase RsbU (regulator of sigma subunit)